MDEIINISDNFKVNISGVTEIGEIVERKKDNSMFCFTIGFIDDSSRNIYLHYDAGNRDRIKKQIEKLHLHIISFFGKNESSRESLTEIRIKR